ncbi:rod-binding protein [Ferrovum sp.]|uniref:rod-binding protein n=1 Tax=Ferrovum sp. TaxID=2609467 RepID=UPI002628BE51|nr:rod-binding protein [Ferrovum sp.]
MAHDLPLSVDPNARLAFDSQALGGLRLKAHQDPNKSLPQVAKQFETVFMNMMMKSMRATVPQDSLGDSQQTKMFTEMLDKQLAQNASKSHGLGLADLIVKQLSPHSSIPHPSSPLSKVVAPTADNLVKKGIPLKAPGVHHD